MQTISVQINPIEAVKITISHEKDDAGMQCGTCVRI